MSILRVFDNIKLPIKMSIIGVLALVGLAIPTYYFAQLSISGQTSDKIELLGIEPASEVVALKKLTAEHRGMSSRLFGGDRTVVGALSSKASEVNSQISKISDHVRASGSEGDLVISGLIDTLQSIESEWKRVRANVESMSVSQTASFQAHSDLIDQQDSLISDMLKVYSLSYDPAAASYHIIIANFVNLPRLANALGKVRGAASGTAAAGEASNVQISTIKGYLNALGAPARDFDYNLVSAADADTRFSSLRRKSETIESDVRNLERLVETQIFEGQFSYTSQQMFSEFSAVINQLYALHDESIIILRDVIEERVAHSSAERNTALIIIAVLFLISFTIGFVIVRSISNSANTLIQAFSKISHQDYSSNFNINRKDEMGIIEKSLAELTAELKEAAIVAIEASKVKQALDSSSMCFMMSNADREIVYMNESVKKLMKESEAAIKKDLPQFDADTLIGTRIDSFHHNPKHQHAVLDQLTKTHEARLDLGGKSFKLNINPIRDEKGNDLGNSVEWLDMTEIFEEEKRVKRVLEALDSSSTNIMIANAEREVIYMNRSMVDTMEEAESDLRKVLPQFRAGDIMGKSMDRFHANPNHQMGILEGLKDTLISEIKVGRRHFKLTANPIYAENGDRIGTVVEWLDRTKEVNAEIEINDMVTASLRGDFTKRIDESDKEGFLKIVSEGLNELIKTTESGLNEVSNVLLAISQGDLTKRITSDYQGTFNDLKNYTNSTTENLVSVISKIREASDTINNASSEIAQGNADLSTRTEQQASSLEETASSMEEITSTVRLNAENANQANGLASQASQVASNGGDLIQEVVVTMSSINESSQKIADIIGVIDGIAFQTNILALNAAVEAARAGEQGRGFAVVASEVRTLAQRSANAAKDIKDLISDSVSKVESGNSLVNQSGETMKEIVTAIQRVNDIMSEIAAASAEQASGIDEVSKAVTQMDEMTQQNAALVEEAAAAAESMRTQASELTGRVGTFKLNESDAPAAMNVESAPRAASPAPTMSQSADPLSQQFAELPSVMSSPKGGNNNEDDEWESF